MTIALAKNLVSCGWVDAARMDDVLQRQVLFGGTVDTNLLETGVLDEAHLMRAMAEVYKLPAATPALLERRDPRMPKLFPARLAQKYQVVPVFMSGRSVVVLACRRVHPLVEDEIGFMLSLSVRTYIVCEARLNLLLRGWMGVEIAPRFDALEQKMGDMPAAWSEAPVEEPHAVEPEPEPVEPSVDAARMERALSGIEEAEKIARVEREKARSGRMSLTEATQRSLKADNRDEIVDVVMRYARQFADFVAIFVIQDEFILGWDAVGSDDAHKRIRRFRQPSGARSMLSTVVRTGAYYLGPVPDSKADEALIEALGRDRPRNALVVPIKVQQRLIALLYGDAGGRNIRGRRIGELLVFASQLSVAFERLILRRKADTGRVRSAASAMADAAALRALGVPPKESPGQPALSLRQPSVPQTGAVAPVKLPTRSPAAREIPAPVDPLSSPQPAEPEAPAPAEAGAFEAEPKEPAPVYAVPFEGEARGAAPAAAGAFEAEPEEAAPVYAVPFEGEARGAAPAAAGAFEGEARGDAPAEAGAFEGEARGAAPAAAGAFEAEPEEPAPVYAVPFEGEARGAAPAAAGAFEAEPAEPAPLGGEARGAEPAAARLVEGESRVRIDLDAGEDLEPVVVDEDLDMEPAIAGEALDIPAAYPLRPTRPIEQRVRIEDLGEDGFTAVDTELGVVSVDTEAGFAPPVSAPAETGSESSPYLLVKQKPGLPELERMESGMPVLLDELCCGDRLRMAAARERLSAQGASVLPQVMTRFPGHLLHDARARQEDQPALVEHSELLHLLVDLGADICPHVVERLEDPDPITRYYAVKILDEVHCTRAVARLSGRLYDRDALVRLAAIDVLQGYRKTTGFRFLLKSLRNRLQSGEPAQQAVSAALLGNFKDAEALPALVDLLGAEDKMVARAALESLSYISKQQFGSSDRKWRKWLDAHRSERRIQWLVAGLRSADRDIRFSSAQELRSLTGQRFGYDFDAPKADREKAARQWERWWEDRGQHLSFED